MDFDGFTYNYNCAMIIMHPDGKINIAKNMLLKSMKDYEASLANSPVGYIVLTVQGKDNITKYIISKYIPVLNAYIEGFLVGRNIDYISYEDFADYMKFFDICEESAKKMLLTAGDE